MPESTADTAPSGAAKMFGDFARDRSLITVAAVVTNGSTGQVAYHLELAKKNGATETELVEAITHLAFYTGWPKAMSAMAVAKQVFAGTEPTNRKETACEPL